MPFNKSKESLKQTPQQQNPYIKIITQMKIQQQNQQKKYGRKKEEFRISGSGSKNYLWSWENEKRRT
jgi:GrpB-like predicted nucleotidyltransferase (UPF0157 family)